MRSLPRACALANQVLSAPWVSKGTLPPTSVPLCVCVRVFATRLCLPSCACSGVSGCVLVTSLAAIDRVEISKFRTRRGNVGGCKWYIF